jgi:hypothetical protein
MLPTGIACPEGSIAALDTFWPVLPRPRTAPGASFVGVLLGLLLADAFAVGLVEALTRAFVAATVGPPPKAAGMALAAETAGAAVPVLAPAAAHPETTAAARPTAIPTRNTGCRPWSDLAGMVRDLLQLWRLTADIALLGLYGLTRTGASRDMVSR